MSKVIYFSKDGENLIHGKVSAIAEGNTQVVAKIIATTVGCDVFEICPKEPYPEEYTTTLAIAEQEKLTQAKPQFEPLPCEILEEESYFLGFPNWCGGMPRIVVSFLESYDFSNKIIYPFCTHEGSAFGNSLLELKEICPDAVIMTGLPIRGSRVDRAEKAVANWLVQYKKTEEQYNGKI